MRKMTRTASVLLTLVVASTAEAGSTRADFNGDGYDDLAISVPGQKVNGNKFAGAVHVLYGSASGLTSIGAQYWHQAQGLPSAPKESEGFGWDLAAGNFNNDFFTDLAIGVPGEKVDGEESAGAVFILYGSLSGLTSTGSQMFTQESSGIPESPDFGDAFGLALTAGDFDGDAYDDLAIGVPGEKRSGEVNAGAVHILYGGAMGLTGAGSQFFDQDDSGVPGPLKPGHEFGGVLCAGDFDGDGYDDLGCGVPTTKVSGEERAGALVVLFGSSTGITTDDAEYWHRDSDGIIGDPRENDQFAAALTVFDVDSNAEDDLLVSSPNEQVGTAPFAGAVYLLFGRPGGLSAEGGHRWHQNRDGVSKTASTGDDFGEAVAGGDWDGDGNDDVAIGVPGETIGGHPGAGMVHVLYSDGIRIVSTDEHVWHQDKTNVNDKPEDQDLFGGTLGMGDFNGDGYDDLAVGVRGETINSRFAAGAVHIFYGDPDGLGHSGSSIQYWHQNKSGIATAAKTNERFGFSMQ